MTFTGKSAALARKSYAEFGASFRRASYLGMLLSTLGFGLMALSGILPSLVALGCGVYLLAAGALWVNAPLLYAAHKQERGMFDRLSFPRALAALLLPAVMLLPAAGLMLLADWVNQNWQVMMATYMTSTGRMILGGGVILLALAGVLLVFSFFSTFCRLSMIALLEAEKLPSLGGVLGASLRRLLTPANLALRRLPWFLLMLILFLGGEGLAFYLSGNFIPGMDLGSQAILFAAWVIDQATWITPLIAANAFVWLMALGFLFWPRFDALRIYHYCRLMKRDGLL